MAIVRKIENYGSLWASMRLALKNLDEAYLYQPYTSHEVIEKMFKAVWDLEQATASMRRALEEAKTRG